MFPHHHSEAEQKVYKFAQSLYDSSLKIGNVQVTTAGEMEWIVLVLDLQGEVDKYAVTCVDFLSSTYTWVRIIGHEKPRRSAEPPRQSA